MTTNTLVLWLSLTTIFFLKSVAQDEDLKTMQQVGLYLFFSSIIALILMTAFTSAISVAADIWNAGG